MRCPALLQVPRGADVELAIPKIANLVYAAVSHNRLLESRLLVRAGALLTQLLGPPSIYTFSAVFQGKARRHTIISRSEEHTSELQSLMRTSYAVFFLKK